MKPVQKGNIQKQTVPDWLWSPKSFIILLFFLIYQE